MSNEHSKQPNHALTDDELDTLLDETNFVEMPPLFTNKVMQGIDALPETAGIASISSDDSNASSDNTQPQAEWWQWAALIGGGIPAFLQVLAFIFSAWNVTSLG